MKDESNQEDSTFNFILPPSSFIPHPCSSLAKKLQHDLTALSFQNSPHYINAMVQLIGLADMKMRVDRSRLFVRCPVDQKRDARLY